MSKQTALQWLEQEFVKLEYAIGVHSVMYELINKAMQMEKEQHFESYRQGNAFLDSDSLNFKGSFEQYYNETYGGQNEH